MNDLQKEILELKNSRKAIILAHNYVTGDLQEIADFVGDSLELSRRAAEVKAEVIVVCGVRFMAETAKLLSPEAKVLLPNPDAGCPMADMADPDEIKKARAAHPGAVVCAYVNTTAATKAEVDICCTSGNAEKIIRSIPKDKEILFLPDRNLGANISLQEKREMILWEGCCPIHDAVTPEMIRAARAAHPTAEIIIHPECKSECVALADRALSTGGMLSYIKTSGKKEFVVATECGILFRLRNENPDCTFYELPGGLLCRDMKKITLENLRDCLVNLAPEVTIPPETAKRAVNSIRAMLAVK